MSWLSSWWDKASGANQKMDPSKLGTQYDDAMSGVNQGYDKISDFASGMMDPYSQQNMAMRSSMNQQGADAAAQGARLGDRSAAMAGGAPAAALAAQTQGSSNQALAGSNQAFNQYLSGAQGQGAGMLSGVLANQGQMQNQKFNMMQNQRQANAMADTQGAQFGANLLGSAIGMIPGLPGGQTGGHVGYQEGGEPLYEGMAYDNIDNQIAFYKEGGSVGPQYGPDGKPRFLLGGLLALGALKKGYDKLGGVKGISDSLKKAKESVTSGLGEMKEQAKATDYHYTEKGAKSAMMDDYLATDEGGEAGKSAATISDEQLNQANVGKRYGDEGFQTREMMEDASTQAFTDTTKAGFDVSTGEHQVGAGKALAETIQPLTSFAGSSIAEGAGLLGKAAVGTAGAIYKGAKGAAGAIKEDWKKEEGSRGKGFLKGASELLKEVGSPGYLQGKEMAKIKRLGKLKDVEPVGTGVLGGTKKLNLKGVINPKNPPPDKANISKQVDNPEQRVETSEGDLVPNTVLSKVGSVGVLRTLDKEMVKTIQASLVEAGYEMPVSTTADGSYDGEVGEETLRQYQKWLDDTGGKQQGGYIGGLLGMQQGGDPAEEEWRQPWMIRNDEFFGKKQWETLEDYQKWYDKAREASPEEFPPADSLSQNWDYEDDPRGPKYSPENLSTGQRELEQYEKQDYQDWWESRDKGPGMQEGGDPRKSLMDMVAMGESAQTETDSLNTLYSQPMDRFGDDDNFTKAQLLSNLGLPETTAVDTSYHSGNDIGLRMTTPEGESFKYNRSGGWTDKSQELSDKVGAVESNLQSGLQSSRQGFRTNFPEAGNALGVDLASDNYQGALDKYDAGYVGMDPFERMDYESEQRSSRAREAGPQGPTKEEQMMKEMMLKDNPEMTSEEYDRFMEWKKSKGMQEGGSPEEQLTTLDKDWEAKRNSNLYTDEGDYTREGLLGQFGYNESAVVDTVYGGQMPNEAIGMKINGQPINLSAGNRWEGDKALADARLRNQWAKEDPQGYSAWVQKSMSADGDPDFDFMNEGNDFMDSDSDMWDFQTGGSVWNQPSGRSPSQVRGGILSQVMGPKGPMNIPTRMGGFRVTG